MKNKSARNLVTTLMQMAGITVNGNQPWDIQIKNDYFYTKVLREKSLGLGETYMEAWWDCQRPDTFIEKILAADLENKIKNNKRILLSILLNKLFNFQTPERALDVGRKHYDLGNDLFECMLDKRMVYTCGYWKTATTLEEAQTAKLELVCQKLGLKPGMTLLDIGCGWGSLLQYAAEKYQIHGVGITISQEQMKLAQQRCAGLPVEIRFQDYREVQQKFDRIASLGMFEHVGHMNYRTYMEVAHRALHDDGLFLLHTIGANETQKFCDEWIEKYIFPNGMLPSMKQLGQSIERLFIMEDWHNFGADYDKTLMAWQENFTKHWDILKNKYDERFYRMWNYYLLSCAGTFRARATQLWQLVLSKNGIRNGYQAPR